MDEIGNYLREIKGFPDFREDSARVSALAKKVRGGDDRAALSLIESTLKYIAELTDAHCHRWNAWPSYLDLVQEANTEVAERIVKYELGRGVFKSFVWYRAQVAFIRFWHKAKTVHVTDYGRKIAKRLKEAHDELTAKLGREPTLEELSERLNMDEADVDAIRNISGVNVLGISDDGEEAGGAFVTLDSIGSEDFDPFEHIQAAELRETLVECLGEENADLLLTYLDSGSEAFRSLYFELYGIELTPEAARQAKHRLMTKMKNCVQFKDRYLDGGGAS
jgi:DNA-directed RNA polymerase specialized sigma subunit